MSDSVHRWKKSMDEESSALLPGRVSRGAGIDVDDVEDFGTVCKRVALAVTVITALLVSFSTVFFAVYVRPEPPIVNFQGLEFREFSISSMNDRSGVPTQGVLVDATMLFSFYNPSIGYSSIVKGVTGSLLFTRMIAFGEVGSFVQPRLSGREIDIDVGSFMNHGPMEPLYGAAPALLEQMKERGSVDLVLEFELASEFSMFHGLVRKEYSTSIKCDIVFAPGDPDHVPGHSEGVVLRSVCSNVQ